MQKEIEDFDVGSYHLTAPGQTGEYSKLFGSSREEMKAHDWEWHLSKSGSDQDVDRLSHFDVYRYVKDALYDMGHNVQAESHELAHAGKTYYGLLTILPQNPKSFDNMLMDYTPFFMFTNDYVGRIPFFLFVGAIFHDEEAVFVDHHPASRISHTKHQLLDRPARKIRDAMDDASSYLIQQDRRFAKWRETPLSLEDTYVTLMRVWDAMKMKQQTAPTDTMKRLRSRPLDGPPFSVHEIASSFARAVVGRKSIETYLNYLEDTVPVFDQAAGFNRNFRF